MNTIYMPKGKAGEYAKYAVNFYNGCSNGCEYCYLKRGVLSTTLGIDKPVLQKRYASFSPAYALDCLTEDLIKATRTGQIDDIRYHGLFFTFSSDPMLEETRWLNTKAIEQAVLQGIPCTILTKRADIVKHLTAYLSDELFDSIAIGFTLTGHDELEPHASPNSERIKTMKELHGIGFRTWASIEPVIKPLCSLGMIRETEDFCDMYKVGLRSGVSKDYYDEDDLQIMFKCMMWNNVRPTYLKDSFIEHLGLNRDKLVYPFVGADYRIFAD